MAGKPEVELLLTWGANSYGQLGLGHKNDVLLPQAVEEFPVSLVSIRSITGGGGHSAVLTDTGELFVCGQNKVGQLGLNHTTDVTHFTFCAALTNRHVVQVACGWDFTVMLTGDGQVLSCGSNSFGQLGLPQKSCAVPQLIEALTEKIVHVAAGLRHALAATEGGQVFQWGTGMASQAKRAFPGKPVSLFLTAEEPCIVTGLENIKVKNVAAGSYHSVSLTDEGVLYVWGSNKHGQLASKEAFVAKPQKIEASVFSGERIDEVWSGWTHVVVQTAFGQSTIMMSVNGLSGSSMSSEVQRAPKLSKLPKFFCGDEQTMVNLEEAYKRGKCGNYWILLLATPIISLFHFRV
uniref:Secretion-regulating guanine nucleotide exchange factor isoform X2 n=1 Tax=Geotrypetes seraphini TaxID=260995 RepID=A0A6P8P400_GEOSA|nr:secretion-regulating guanine nucleotide exchange factor isoform X2 [Geotrypetes seraphini]